MKNRGTIEAYTNTYGIGVRMHGGSVVNYATGTITGVGGISFDSSLGTLSNAGTIKALVDPMNGQQFDGVELSAGGVVTNLHGAMILGKNGIEAAGAPATIVNAGVIWNGFGGTGNGIVLGDGGSVTNQTGGVVEGVDGIQISGAGTVDNSGKIAGYPDYRTDSGIGVFVAGGSVTNRKAGQIVDGYGIVFTGAAGTASNAGVITGSSVDGVDFDVGGALANAATGVISGIRNAVAFYQGYAGILVNDGTIDWAIPPCCFPVRAF